MIVEGVWKNLTDFEIPVKLKIKTKYINGICSEHVRIENEG